jgi:hypothetical protein
MTTVTLSVTTTSRPVMGNGGGGGGAIPPSNTVAPVLSGTPTVGQTLSCSTGTWLGTLPITYTYQWRRGVSNISGATSSTYTLVQADASFAVTCIVTATNAAGSADSTSNSLTIVDADAQAFITAAVLTNPTQQSAINTLVVSLKGFGIWTKMKAIYPFVGGTAALHKWNLKDPQDLDAAYRLVFLGGWTHSSTGALPNGTNGYANTFLNANTALQQFSHHHSFYHNTDNSGTGLRSMGGAQSSSSFTFRTTIETSGTTLTFRDLGLTNTETPVTASSLKGFRASSRTANNNMFIVKADGTSTTSTTTTATNALPSLTCYLAAHNNAGAAANYASMSIAFHSLGDGLSAAEGLSLRNAVVTFNTTLGR